MAVTKMLHGMPIQSATAPVTNAPMAKPMSRQKRYAPVTLCTVGKLDKRKSHQRPQAPSFILISDTSHVMAGT